MSKKTELNDGHVAEPAEADGVLTIVTVESEDQPTECTLFPYNTDVEEIATRWITATEETVLTLEEMR